MHLVTVAQWDGASASRATVALGAIGRFTMPLNGYRLLAGWADNGF